MNIKLSVLAGVFTLLSACASSSMGPGAGVAEGTVKGSVNDVNQHAQNVFHEMNIQMTGSSVANAGNELELTGKLNEDNISVKIDRQDKNTSTVKVDASKNIVNGQQQVAQNILNKIVSES